MSDNSWVIDFDAINKDTWDLGVKNPNIVETIDNRTPKEIISEIEDLDKQTNKFLKEIRELL